MACSKNRPETRMAVADDEMTRGPTQDPEVLSLEVERCAVTPGPRDLSREPQLYAQTAFRVTGRREPNVG